MANELICELTTFSTTTTLHFSNGTSQKVPTAELGQLLATVCNIGGISKVKFICDNKDYVEGIIEEAKIQSKENYGFDDIEYEVI